MTLKTKISYGVGLLALTLYVLSWIWFRKGSPYDGLAWFAQGIGDMMVFVCAVEFGDKSN